MIPDNIRRLIVQFIPSVPFLEALLLLREDRQSCWSTEQLARRLYLSPHAAEALLAQLTKAELLEPAAADSDLYRYRPYPTDVEALMDELAHVYRHNLVEVSTLIHKKTSSKAAAFADALVWRRKEQ